MKCKMSKQTTNLQGVKIVTNYKDAVNWLHNDFILCNDIVNIDDSIYENQRFESYDEETETDMGIFQYYLTSASESDIEYLEKRFGLLFSYSDKLDLYVLCVNHYGTAWDYVDCQDAEEGK